MFGMGLGEILLIAIIAVLFLGPEKLPQTMVEIAKFFRQVKGTVNEAKATLQEEMNFSEIKEKALEYKNELTNASAELERMASVTEIGSEIKSIKNDLSLEETKATPSAPAAPKEPEIVTFKPKSKETESPEIKPQENA